MVSGVLCHAADWGAARRKHARAFDAFLNDLAAHGTGSVERWFAVPGSLELEEAVCLGDQHHAVP